MDSDLLDVLRLRNVDVLSTNESQMFSRSHEEQLKWALEISENECRDVALLRLYKGFG